MKKNGFELIRQKGSHNQYYNFKTGITVPVPIHKGRDIGRGLFRTIIKESGVSMESFLDELGINN